MASIERAERIGGFTLLGIPVFDSAVFALDNYARLELIVRLHDVVPPFLLNPVFVFVCLCAGLFLLERSYKEQIKRIVNQPSGLVGVEAYRQTRVRGLMLPFMWTCFAVLVLTSLLAIAYSLAYKGTPPVLAQLRAPSICKTADCWPKRVAIHSASAPIVISAPKGNAIGPVTGNGNYIAPSVTNNFGESARRIPEDRKQQLISDLSIKKGIVNISYVGGNGDAGQFANDWYKVLHDAGWTMKGGIDSVVSGGAPMVGVLVTIKGEPVADDVPFSISRSHPGAVLANALMSLTTHVRGQREQTLGENEIKLYIGVPPRTGDN